MKIYYNSQAGLPTEATSGKTIALALAVLAQILQRTGGAILRYGLVLVLLWIGGMKFTGYEAAGIAPLEIHSPLMNWLYYLLGERNLSNLLGVIEITLGLGIALYYVAPLVSGIASLLSVGMFLTTLSFLFTTPGWEPTLGGFPGISAMPGQFLLKDIVLLGAAVFTASEAFGALSAPEPEVQHGETAPSPKR
jgi:reactive chlorine resistance protein C